MSPDKNALQATLDLFGALRVTLGPCDDEVTWFILLSDEFLSLERVQFLPPRCIGSDMLIQNSLKSLRPTDSKASSRLFYMPHAAMHPVQCQVCHGCGVRPHMREARG